MTRGTLGQRLQAAIDAKNISHSWVAEEVGITTSALSNILGDKVANPRFFTILAITRAIKEPIGAITGDTEYVLLNSEWQRLAENTSWTAEILRKEPSGERAPLEIPPRRPKAKQRKTVLVPRVAATPNLALDNEARELRRRRIPSELEKLGVNAAFTVTGDSMLNDGIEEGDLLYVKMTSDISSAIGRNVVCRVGEYLLVKRLDIRGRKIVLRSANRKYKTMTIDEDAEDFALLGIVLSVRHA